MTIPKGLAAHLVPVLDLSSPAWPSTWQTLSELAASERLGGILLRRGLRADWQKVTREACVLADRKPLLMADFEQGAASQVTGYVWLPKAFTVGATRCPGLARRMGQAVAWQAREMGIDMALAPVADLLFASTHSVIGTRSFGATPELVGAMVAAFITGCQGEGVKAVVKHFPGHGRSHDDSHQHLASIKVSPETWAATDAVPFRMAIEAGVSAVMVGHIWSEGLDPGHCRPASRSPVVIRQLLRDHMGFSGLILTDSLEMIGAGGADLAAASGAVEAGVDLVIGPDLGFAKDSARPMRQDSGDGAAVIGAELAQEIAQKAVAWLSRFASSRATASPGEVLVVPDRSGRSDWAAPLEAALRSRPAPSDQGYCVIAVSGPSDAAEAQRHIDRVAGSGSMPVVLIAFGAIDLARQASHRMGVILTGDATSASQEAAVRLLCGEIRSRGNPDLPHA